MKLENVLTNVGFFLLIWIGIDASMGRLDASTWGECLAAITMAAMLYFD